MNIHIHQQLLQVGQVEIIAVSSGSNFQVGDNDQVLLYSTLEVPPNGIQIGPFPRLPNHHSGGLTKVGGNNPPFTMGLDALQRKKASSASRKAGSRE